MVNGRRHVGMLLVYALLALALTWPLARQVGTAIPGDSFDGWQNVWNLWWMREAWLVQHSSAYFTSLLHYPTGVDLRFQTMAPFNGLATLSIQLSAGLLPAYNAAVLLSFVLGGYGAYLLALYALRGWGRQADKYASRQVGRYASRQGAEGEGGKVGVGAPGFIIHRSSFIVHSSAFLAGVIFAFSPYHFAHTLGHLQLIALQWIPFYVLYLLRGLDGQVASGRWQVAGGREGAARSLANDAFKAGLFLILVGLVDWYYVMYCLLFTGFVLAVYLAQRRLTWRGVGVAAGAVAFFGLALSPLLLPMVQAARSWSGSSLLRGVEETRVLAADLLAFVTPQVFHPLWGDWALQASARFTATPSEYTVFAGFTVLALCGIALLATRTRRTDNPDHAAGQSNASQAGLPVDQDCQSYPSLARRTDSPPPAAGQSSASQAGLPVDQDCQSYPLSSPSARPGLYLLSAAFFALLALGPVLKINGRTDLLPGGGEIPLPYRLLYEFVPFVKLSRSVSRMDVMVMLFLGVGAAFGVVVLVDWLRGRLGNWEIGKAVVNAAPVVAIGLVLFEFWPAPYPVSPPDTPAWYATLAEDPTEGAVLNLPANYERPWYLLYQTVHGKPLATGYVTRDDPAVLRERAPVLSHFWFLGPDIHTQQFDLAGQGVQVLHDLGVRWVVLDRYKMPGGPEREITDAYAQAIFAGQTPLFEDERITIYAVPEPAVRGPYLILAPGWRPRQSDDSGRLWRALPAGEAAGLEIVNPDGRPLALEITAAGEGTLRLLDEAGTELAAWQLADGMTATPLGPVTIPPATQRVWLESEGAETTVYELNITPVR
ncbi:MAG: hypothetical protein WA040_06305 [Anaerolineae bacterium]